MKKNCPLSNNDKFHKLFLSLQLQKHSALSITKNVTLSIMALDEMTFSVVTHSLTALWIIKYSVINDYQHNDTQHSKKM
jgi:hypothetical protein